MSTINYCRLCVNIGMDFKNLYDENGQATEVYDLTRKYFDESILNRDDAKHLSMVCFQCWDHIWDFNNFQQAVLMAQTNLDAIKHTEISPLIDEQPGSNVLTELQQQTTSTNEDCICLSESEESSPPPNEEYIALGQNPEEATNVDLTLDEDNIQQEDELDYTVDQFFGGEFGNYSGDVTTQTQMECIDLDTDSNCAAEKTPETISASESDSKSPNPDNHIESGIHQENQNFFREQLASFYRLAKKRYDKNFQKSAIKKSFVCFLCLQTCIGIENLIIHSQCFHPNKSVKILCCKRGHEGMSRISTHFKYHYKSPIFYSCELCNDKSYTTKSSLTRHMLQNHPTEW